AHRVAVAGVDRDVVGQALLPLRGVGVAVQPHRHVDGDPARAVDGHALPVPAHTAVVAADGGPDLGAGDRQELLLDPVVDVVDVAVATLGGEVAQVVRVVGDRVGGVVGRDGDEDVVGGLRVGRRVVALGRLHRQVVDQQVEGAADGEHVGVVVRLGPTVLAAPPGDRVLAGGDLPATLQHRMHVPVHDQVRDVHAHDVVRDELLLEA